MAKFRNSSANTRRIGRPSGSFFGASGGLAALTVSAAIVACGGSGGSPGDATGGSPSGSSGATSSSAGATSSSAGATSSSAGAASGGAPSGFAGAPASVGGAAVGGAPSAGGSGPGNPAAGSSGAPPGGTGGGAAGAGGSSGNKGGGGGGGAQGGAGGGSGGSTSVTCPSTVLKAGDTTQTVMVGSTSRTYVLHVPAKYDGTKATPLVVDFHPLGGSGPSERTGSPYPAQTDPDGVVMAFPSGMAGPSGGAWNVGPCCVKNVDDVAFAKALVAQVEQKACIDPKRVYAVGFSMGGGMSHYLACHAADVFAAVSPAAFDLLKENVTDCKPPRPISVISFRSTGDPVVAYAGGYSAAVSGMPINFLGAKATFAQWAQLNQCTGSASAEDSSGCAKYSGCAGGVDVILCTKQGGGHDPGNASVSWPILKQHTLP